jgi:hypothetical protein
VNKTQKISKFEKEENKQKQDISKYKCAEYKGGKAENERKKEYIQKQVR